MSQDKRLRFITHDDIEVEELPRGRHEWLCRPGLTETENLLFVRVRMPPGKAHRFHHHPVMEEIIYIVSGKAEQWVEQTSRLLGPGEMVHVPKGVVHGTYNVGDDVLVFLAILSPVELEEPVSVDVAGEDPWRSIKTPIDHPDVP